MSIPRIVLAGLAAGGLLAAIALANSRRERSRERELALRSPSAVEPWLEPTAARASTGERSEVAPGDIVLPLAFWDAAAELDPEDELPLASHALGLSEEPYDSIALEDASATWLSRATQAPAPPGADIDDPAEIAADSMSMVSEASRNAAADRSLFEERGPESSA